VLSIQVTLGAEETAAHALKPGRNAELLHGSNELRNLANLQHGLRAEHQHRALDLEKDRFSNILVMS